MNIQESPLRRLTISSFVIACSITIQVVSLLPSRADDPHAIRQNDDDVSFLTAVECAICHSFSNRATAMRDQQNRNVAPFDLWSGSMMANSARDPYWRAAVSAEVAATPSQKNHIEEICSRCHTPMAAPISSSPEGEVLSFLNNKHPKSNLGLDGVSCTVCHQISPQNLGTDESFTGGFVYNREKAIYGPHADPITMPMQRHVNYTPKRGDHILTSAMCATCHTVITHSFDADGRQTAAVLHEQAPYLEWRNSIFNNEVATNSNTGKSCQDCHMPTTDMDGQVISTKLAHNPGGRDFPFLHDRQPFGRHSFAGGNLFMTRLIRDNRSKLGIKTGREAFDLTIQETQKMLRTQTARIAIDSVDSNESGTLVVVSIENLSGHKFPTAYPSRRAWIEMVVHDDTGKIVFASGRSDAKGQLVGSGEQVLQSEIAGSPPQRHYRKITDSEQVQIYETIMADQDGKPTFTLLRGSHFLKDNRLLPKGWAQSHADAVATKPVGVDGDTDFLAGTDQVSYQLALPNGSYRVSARLMFQSLSNRYMEELFQHDTPEVRTFKAMYDLSDRVPEEIATAGMSIILKD